MPHGRRRLHLLAVTVVAALVTGCGSGATGSGKIVAPSVPLGWSDVELVAYVTRHLDRLSNLPEAPDWSDDLQRVDGRVVVTSGGGTVFVATRYADDPTGHAAGDALCDALAASLRAATDLPDPLHALVVTGEANATLAQCAPRAAS